ncbi:uncharacterized protein CC84DRAFT_1212843 [Paraphaeosphaeria sporulosa]|uniref:Uncharacterized protein n=1 Tax=Paraphaeosphaeria sporulosa TaxID=1460663 RepID=A0A177CPG1_9PLEO|nr:uncharacterized protein CC84DRAFT_1212843 [Paraphaeosphaeria sporulosa]OAG09404.1 hypothetical protein CC84DRAFT_1212843 [Paraphaeosphaeria sporulosa]
MSPKSFLVLPVTIRERIYTELLVPPPSHGGEYLFRPSDVATSILYVNRQVYAESSDILYSKNMFMIVRSNNDLFGHLSLKPPIRIHFPGLEFVDKHTQIVPHRRFAMSMEFLSIGWKPGQVPWSLRNNFVITAQALPNFMIDLAAALSRATQISVGQLQIHNIFRYSELRFAELVFGPVLSMQRLPPLKALSIRGPLPQEHRQKFLAKLLQHQDRIWYDFSAAYGQCRSCIRDNMYPGRVHSDLQMQWNIANSRYLLSALDIVWDFHEYTGFQHDKYYAKITLFQCVADLYTQLVLAHLIEAKRNPDQAIPNYLAARRSAEEGISYLSRGDHQIDRGTFEMFPSDIREENLNLAGHAKAKLSLKAMKACIKLDDGTGAKFYLQNAHKQDSSVNLDELRLKLAWKNLPEANESGYEFLGTSQPVRWHS